MRIICPDCEAQYEVPEEAIPPEGRDVQCSNCNTTWFCEHPDHPATAQQDRGKSGEAEATVETPTGPAAPSVAPAKPDTPVEPGAPVEVTRREDPEAEAPLPPPRRELDPTVASILREEARRETEARRAEGLETQPELGLTEGERRVEPPARESQAADAPGAQPAEAERRPEKDHPASKDARDATRGPGATAHASEPPRRGLLPDVEEINSSLRSPRGREGARSARQAQIWESAPRRRGFRGGFLAAVVIFVIGALVYQFAPEIADAVPQADPWLSNYVTWADQTRTMLDRQVQHLLAWFDALTATDP